MSSPEIGRSRCNRSHDGKWRGRCGLHRVLEQVLSLGALARRSLVVTTLLAASCSDGGSESSEALIWIGQTPDDAAADDSDNKA
jgi:hypothetical protein